MLLLAERPARGVPPAGVQRESGRRQVCLVCGPRLMAPPAASISPVGCPTHTPRVDGQGSGLQLFPPHLHVARTVHRSRGHATPLWELPGRRGWAGLSERRRRPGCSPWQCGLQSLTGRSTIRPVKSTLASFMLSCQCRLAVAWLSTHLHRWPCGSASICWQRSMLRWRAPGRSAAFPMARHATFPPP